MLKNIFMAIMILLQGIALYLLLCIIVAGYILFMFYMCVNVSMWFLLMIPLGIAACIALYHKLR